jgi:hypothetical protein
MKNLRLIAIASGGLLVSVGVILAACSDDTSVNGESGDSGPESSVIDSGPDAQPDANIDSGFQVETFPRDIGEAICESLARCCYGDANLADGGAVDGGTFAKGKCVDSYRLYGFEGSDFGLPQLDGGNVELDHAKALDCIAKVKGLSCTLSGTEFQAIRDACFSSLRGKLTSGACKSSMECAQGFFCKRPVGSDAGTGTCTAMRGLGAACGDVSSDPFVADEACSWRSGGDTRRYCEFLADFDAGTEKDAGDWKCASGLANGQPCYVSQWCASGICDENTLLCSSPVKYFGGACNAYINP